MLDDLVNCFHSDLVTLSDRCAFMLAGCMWKEKHIKPFNNLTVVQLRLELKARGVQTDGKLKEDLQVELNRLRKGKTNFPLPIQPNPSRFLDDIHLSQYEVSPVEPLHDIEGHMSNVFAELKHKATGTAVERIKLPWPKRPCAVLTTAKQPYSSVRL